MPLKSGGNVSYFLPLHFRERCLGYYIFTNSQFPTKSLLCHTLILNISNSVENIRKLLHLNSMIDELDKLYVIDPLCNIYNRNGFIRTADTMFRRCQEAGSKLLISFIDMDGLKMINDNYGHKEGDFALQRLAAVISECCRSGRICARFGGDEFIIIMETADRSAVDDLCAKIRSKVRELDKAAAAPYEISLSIGISEFSEGMNHNDLIASADQKLYEQRRNRR